MSRNIFSCLCKQSSYLYFYVFECRIHKYDFEKGEYKPTKQVGMVNGLLRTDPIQQRSVARTKGLGSSPSGLGGRSDGPSLTNNLLLSKNNTNKNTRSCLACSITQGARVDPRAAGIPGSPAHLLVVGRALRPSTAHDAARPRACRRPAARHPLQEFHNTSKVNSPRHRQNCRRRSLRRGLPSA
jgi:hypothetical protein